MRSSIQCMALVALVVTVCWFGCAHGRTSDELRVKLGDESRLVGRFLRSISGRGIRAFLGVPYAQPPVGDLRFKAPLPQLPWNEERQAVEDGSYCTQRDPYRRDYAVSGSEDCLYLHVYAPLRPATPKPPNVMVFFHGGGFMCGAGTSAFYGPDHLLDHDIVYVGVNYRLGPLGFLSTGQKDCPGNNGLKDQRRALQWVQENIASFGGDPEQVTIFGESAGGASVTYHMMSPLSKGLFKRAISQSGTNLAAWARPAQDGVAVRRAEKLASLVGCPKGANSWADTLNCIRKVDGDTITKQFYEFFEWDTDPMIPFPPVVEPDLPGAFITQHPRDVARPHGLTIPWLTGLTNDEGSIKSSPILNAPELYADFNKEYDRLLPLALYYDHHGQKVQRKMSDQISEFYFGGQRLTEETHQNLTNLFTDAWFLAGMDEYLHIRLAQGSAAGPTFTYLFAHSGEASFTEIFQGGREKYYGVSHAEELQSLFPIAKHLFVSAVATELDDKVRESIVALWVNFARTGHPTTPPSSSSAPDFRINSALNDIPVWNPTRSYPLDYLRIGTKDFEGQSLIAMESGLMAERAEFWRKLNAHSPKRLTDHPQSHDENEL